MTPFAAPDVRFGASRRDRWRYLIFIGPITVTSVLTILAAVPPGGSFMLALVAAPLWLWSLCAWVAVLAIGELRRDLILVLAPPFIGALALVLAYSDIPMRTAFLVSESALVEYADSLPEGEKWTGAKERVGLFTIDGAQRRQGVAHLFTTGGGILEKCGFAYVSDGRLKDLDASTVNHITGDWYATCTDFD
ncbi:hypothetical protein [Streptosporangium sp. NPDC002607]